MQGQQSAVGSLPEVIGFDHGSTSSDASFDQQMCWTSVENPSSQLPDFLLSSSNTNMGHLNAANHQGQDFCRWDFGESSSRARQDDTGENDQKTEHEWPAPMNVCAGSMLISEQQYQSSNRDDVNQTLMIHNSGSHQIPQDLNMNCEVDDDDDDDDDDDCRVLEFPHLFKSGGSRNEQLPFASSSSNPFGPPPGSGGYLVEESDGRPGCSLDGPRVSCKRKTLEGSAGQPSEGGSTSSPQHTESRLWHTLPAPQNASSSSNLTVTEETSFSFNPPEQVNPRLGLSFGQVAPVYLPSLDASGATDSSRRNFRMRINAAHQQGYVPNSMFSLDNDALNTNNQSSHHSLRLPLPSNLLDLRSASASAFAAGSMGAEGQPVAVHSHHSLRVPLPSNLVDLRSASAAASGGAEGQPVAVHSDQSLRLPLPSNLLDLRSASAAGSGGAEGQPVAVHVTSLRPISQSRWNGSANLRNGAALSSVGSGLRNAAQHETSSSTSMPSNIADYPMFVPPNELRSSLQSAPNWGLAGRNVDVSGNVASTSRSSSGTGVQSASPSWVPHRSPSQYQRRMGLAEYVRQSLAADTVSGSENGIYSQSGASSSQEIAPTSGSGSQGRHSHSRSAMLLDRRTDGAFGIPYSLRNLAVAGEGRSRLVSEMRNVLDLVRRGEGLRFEDVMILDQSVFFGMADRYDRHRDMRLDVDNMSYEELLALEEHIGNVNTGLSEESIQKQLKQQNYVNSEAVEEETEPCCICQEEYSNGEVVGLLDCGHDFHAGCIKQWLMVKNLCPICKTTGLNK